MRVPAIHPPHPDVGEDIMGRRSIYLLAAVVSIAGAAACTSTEPSEPTESPTAASSEDAEVTVERGAAVVLQMGCSSCHTTNGNVSVGPTWQGLVGSERTFADGSRLVADEAYLRESILDPNAKVVEGFFPGIMPQNFADRLSENEVDSVIEYVKTLQ